MRYIATGRIHPERADIRFTPIKWEVTDDGWVIAQCEASQITVCMELKSVDDLISAHIRAESFTQIVVGALGFSLGSGYSIELIQVVEENGTPHVFGVRPTFGENNESLGFEPHDLVFNCAFQLSNQDVFFRLALRDYLRAIVDVTDCAAYCYRAIESIRSSFGPETKDGGWQAMHETLGTNKEMIDCTVKDYADPIRHGNWTNAKVTTLQIRWDMLSLTRKILSSYLDSKRPST